MAVAVAPAAVVAQPPAADPVQTYLQRLNLPEYEIAFLELEYARPARRDAVAPRLAEAYVDRLLDIDNPAEADQITQKVKDLVKRHPVVNSVRVQLLLTQGEYMRAETLAGKWLLDPADRASAKAAAEILDRILPDLDRHADEQGKILARETAAMERLPQGPSRKPAEERVNRVGQLFGRAAFFSGWGNYYHGLLRTADGQLGDVSYRKARDVFRKLVPVGEPPAEIDSDELQLASPVQARAILGLALTEAATGETKVSQGWFKVLEHRDVPDEVRAALDFWKLFALLRHGGPGEAVAFARTAVDAFIEYSAPRRNFCVLLVQAGAKDPAGPLTDLGLRGLVQMRQYDLAKKLGAKLVTDETSPAGQLIQAMGRLDAAEKSKSADDFKTAAAALEAIAADAERRKEPGLALRARYQAGYALARAEDWAAAAKVLDAVAPALKAARSDLAGDAAWARIVAYDKLAAKDPQTKLKLADLLRDFGSSFPDHPKSKAASLMLASSGGATAADKIEATDPAFADKVLLAGRQAYNQWRGVKGDAAREAELGNQVYSAVEKFLAARASNSATQLEALFMGTDVAVNSAKPDAKRAAEWLAAAAPLAEPAPPDAKPAVDLRVLRLQFAQTTGDVAAAKAAADWLIQHRPNTPYHEAALVGRAKAADKALANTTPGQINSRIDDALAAYRDLTAHVGTTPDRIKASKNAQIANSRLATLTYDRNRFDECRTILEDRLLKAFPRETKYLRLAGLVYDRLQMFEQSLECWRLLTKGLPPDSDGWYEAKYHHMSVLARVNKAEARQAFEQFKALRPEYGPAALKDKFKQLEQSLKD